MIRDFCDYGHEYTYTFSYTGNDNVKVDLRVNSGNAYWLDVYNCLKSDSITSGSNTVEAFKDNIRNMKSVNLRHCSKQLILDVLDVFDNGDRISPSTCDSKYFQIYREEDEVVVNIYGDPPKKQ